MIKTVHIKTKEQTAFYNITSYVRQAVIESGVNEGIAVVFCPHTTAGITINENSDPDVQTDMIYGFEKIMPTNDPVYRHYEGNSHAHMKSTTFGASQTLIIEDGAAIHGIWQAVYFCEFDGPRNRTYYVKVIEG
jgi:secondary thiamine-phosphate synthase enzyme